MDDIDVEEQLCLVKKPHCKSAVWNYFGLELNENNVLIKEQEDKPVSIICKKIMLAKGGNILNMLTHLCNHHAELYAEAMPVSSQSNCWQPTIKEAFDRSKGMT